MSILSVSCVASLLCCWLTLLSISFVMHEELYTLYLYVHISIEISRFGVFYATPHSGNLGVAYVDIQCTSIVYVGISHGCVIF